LRFLLKVRWITALSEACGKLREVNPPNVPQFGAAVHH
jgi:hypothetical protein